jgi:hypothetical protein
VGWGTVVLGLFLEYSFRNSIGIVMSAAVGFVTQIVAYNPLPRKPEFVANQGMRIVTIFLDFTAGVSFL